MDDKDPWLERWLPLMQEAAAGEVLELGCDTGRDTAWLARHGFSVVATDISPKALAECAANVPAARLVRHNLRQPFPFADGAFPLVLASLCLHYFPWTETRAIAAELRRVMRHGGLLLCRLNSTRDLLHGAAGYREIEPNFYAVDGRYSSTKRFFDEASVRDLFGSGWRIEHLEECTIDRYDLPKVAWEAVLRAC